jgi:SAM-dependent methyltransferase
MASLRWHVIRKILGRIRPGNVLEIGCGQGSVGARIARRAEYIGLEQDTQSYLTAKARIEPAGGRVLNGGLDMVTGPFDLVCAFEVIEHVEDDAAALREWTALVQPAGSVLLSVPAWPERFGAWDELVGHYRRYTPERLEGMVREAGCSDFEYTLYGWPLGYVTEPIRNQMARRRRAGGTEEGSMSARTAKSGRLLQPGALGGIVIQAGTVPFAALQRLRPGSGIGLVGVGRVL